MENAWKCGLVLGRLLRGEAQDAAASGRTAQGIGTSGGSSEQGAGMNALQARRSPSEPCLEPSLAPSTGTSSTVAVEQAGVGVTSYKKITCSKVRQKWAQITVQ